jgi:hypothetical protein
VDQIEPEAHGLNLKCVVVAQPRLVKDSLTASGAEAKQWVVKVADETGSVDFLLEVAEIGNSLREGTHMTLRNVFVEMMEHKYIQLQANGWSKLDVESKPHDFKASASPNRSEIEYEVEGH